MSTQAKKLFITPKTTDTVLNILENNPQTKSNAHIILESGAVWYNKKRISDKNTIIKEKETLKIYTTSLQGTKFSLDPKRIIFENDDFIIVNKPPNLSTSSERSNIYFNLRYGVEAYINRNIKNKNDWYKPQPLTRLDLHVTGLVLLSKNKTAEKELFRLTKERKIKKAYHAILPKLNTNPNCKRIKDKLDVKGPVRVSNTGKDSHSLFIKQSTSDSNYDYYTVILLTGRRHQIRVHASHYISPIIGDNQYGSIHSYKKNQIGLTSFGLNFKLFGKRYRIRLSS